MKKKNKYDYNTFKELFDSHILYAYEPQYGCKIHQHYIADVALAEFHKLSIYDDGTLNYKGHTETYDPRLWPKVVQLVELLQETPAEKILYKPENKKKP
jgi:hypothetical protein